MLVTTADVAARPPRGAAFGLQPAQASGHRDQHAENNALDQAALKSDRSMFAWVSIQ